LARGVGYKTGNIYETIEDREKVTINSLYKVVHGLSIDAKVYDLEWPLREIQGHWFQKMAKYSLVMTTPCRVAALCLLGVRRYSLTYLLT